MLDATQGLPMATSKNRRKNGKVVRSDRNKRMRVQAAYDLKNLVISNCVDRQELEGGRTGLRPRTVVYDRKSQQTTAITKLQEVALKTERWKWNIHSGVICRNPDGEVYLDKEENIFTQTEVTLSELNDYIAESLVERFEKANPNHKLTTFWVASPYDMGDVPLRAVLAPFHVYNVLGSMLTKYETDKIEHQVVHFKADTLADFEQWFIGQRRHRELLKQTRLLKIRFEPTGKKMKKGELVKFRECLSPHIPDFHPFATPQGFAAKQIELSIDGFKAARILTLLDPPPACLDVYTEEIMQNGTRNAIKFYNPEG